MKDIVLLGLVILGTIAYYSYNRKLKKQNKDGSSGKLTAWLSGFSGRHAEAERAMVQPSKSAPTTAGQNTAEVQEQIAEMLDDIYKEFMSETEQMRVHFSNDMQQLRSDVFSRLEEIERKLEEISTRAVSRQTVPRSDDAPEPTHSLQTAEKFPKVQEDKSFRILEALYSGKTVAETAASLEVGVQEVELVRQVLQSPPSQ